MHCSVVGMQILCVPRKVSGIWYIFAVRPPKGSGQCVLGRETAIQKMVWNEEGWLRMACGGTSGSGRQKSQLEFRSIFSRRRGERLRKRRL